MLGSSPVKNSNFQCVICCEVHPRSNFEKLTSKNDAKIGVKIGTKNRQILRNIRDRLRLVPLIALLKPWSEYCGQKVVTTISANFIHKFTRYLTVGGPGLPPNGMELGALPRTAPTTDTGRSDLDRKNLGA